MLQDSLSQRIVARQILLDRIVSTLSADERFVAAWLTGSLGRQAGDPLSDLDLSVVVATAYADDFCRRLWMVAGHTTPERLALFQRFGTPTIIHENHYNAADEGSFSVVIYVESALTVDWTLIPASKATRPLSHVMLFNTTNIPMKSADTIQSRQERAEKISERVAFFWMMTAVAVKYLLRGDVVYFHMLLDNLHRTFNDVSRLIEDEVGTYRGGSIVALAATQPEQIAAIQEIAHRMLALRPLVIELGGYVPDHPMAIIDQLLALMPITDPDQRR